MVETLINGRWTLLLPDHRAARPEWATGWETERLAAMHDVLAGYPGHGVAEHVVFDVGAEEGDLPALWASWGADVMLIEPNPKVWPNIRAIFEANDLEERVLGCHVGFAGETVDARPEWRAEHDGGEQYLGEATWPSCAYGAVIGDHGFLVLPERPEVDVTTIDRLAEERGEPTVITIDVEGAELTVLRGARQVLATARPTVFVSVHIDLPWIDEKYPGDTREAVLAYMDRLDYRGTHLATDHEEHWRFDPVPCTDGIRCMRPGCEHLPDGTYLRGYRR